MNKVEMINDMDKECIELCDAMNFLSDIRTIESCCGHNKTPYQIWFRAKNLKALPKLLYYFDGCHCGFYGWKVLVTTDCGMSPVTFCIEGPVGEQAYSESKKIAELLREEAKKFKK
jgi:hypothetical protein